MQRRDWSDAQEFALNPLSFKRGLSRRTTTVILVVQNQLPRRSSSTPGATAGETLGLLGRLESVAAVVFELAAHFKIMVVGGFPSAVIIPSGPSWLTEELQGC